MWRKRILSQKRPAAGGEARSRASFLLCRKKPAFCLPLYREQGLSVKKFPVDVQDRSMNSILAIILNKIYLIHLLYKTPLSSQ